MPAETGEPVGLSDHVDEADFPSPTSRGSVTISFDFLSTTAAGSSLGADLESHPFRQEKAKSRPIVAAPRHNIDHGGRHPARLIHPSLGFMASWLGGNA
jgi:hypothetical protein